MLKYLSDGLRFLCREGSWTLKPHEQVTLSAALNALPEDIAVLALKQLEQRFFIERQSEGRIPCFRYYKLPEPLLLPGRFGSGEHFIEVRLQTEARSLTAKCVLHGGAVFGLEFPKPARFFRNQRVEALTASCADTSLSYTEVIDRAEHGSGN